MSFIYKKAARILILAAAAVLTAGQSWGQRAVSKRFTMDDGLSSNGINNIIQDHMGFIWFGTGNGLNRYDGTTIKTYNYSPGNNGGLSSNAVFALFEDSRNRMWVGLDNGLDIYDPQTDSFYRFPIDLPDTKAGRQVNVIFEDSNGDIWLGCTYGVYRYDASSEELGLEYSDITGVTGIMQDRKGDIWISTFGYGIYKSDRSTGKLSQFVYTKENPQISDNCVLFSFEDSYGNLWIGTYRSGLERYDESAGRFVNYKHTDPDNVSYHLHHIMEYSPGKLMLASDNGISVFAVEEKELTYLKEESAGFGLGINSFVYSILKDAEGSLWFGTFRNGVEFRSAIRNNFGHHSTRMQGKGGSVTGSVVNTLCEDAGHNIWIGTDDNGIMLLDAATRQVTPFRTVADIGSSYYCVHDILVDNGKLFTVNYERGIEVIDSRSRTSKRYLLRPDQQHYNAYVLYRSSNGRIFASTDMGVFYYNRETDDFVNIGIYDMAVSMVEDNDRHLWIATNRNGLFCYDQKSGNLEHFTHDHGNAASLTHNSLTSLAIDGKGRLWVACGTYGMCLFDYQTKTFTRYEDLRLSNNKINGLVSSGNMMWISTERGLASFDPDSGAVVNTYTRSKGIYNDQFSPNSVLKTSDGRLWFGSADGVCSFFPQELSRDQWNPRVLITRMTIFGEDVDCTAKDSPLQRAIQYSERVRLKAHQSVVGLEFSSMSFVAPEDNNYMFRLEGIEKEWRIADGRNNKITYANIPPGDYRFVVRAANSDGVWSDRETTLAIEVQPPFFRSAVAVVLYIILGLASLALLTWYLLHRYRKRQRANAEKMNSEKEREIYSSKIEFFTNIAHEIRTPLSLIIGPLEYLMKSSDISDRHGDYFNTIEQNYRRLYALVNQLLDFRKMDSGIYKPSYSRCNVGSIAEDVISLFDISARQKRLEISLSVEPENMVATSDGEALTKIISNLITNAIKNTETSVSVNIRDCGESVRIDVADDGKGVPEKDRGKIFDAFYQSDDSAPIAKMGLGIGLYMTRSLVSMLGGTISVSDRNDGQHGAQFTVMLPKHSTNGAGSEDVVIEKNVNEYFVDTGFEEQFPDDPDEKTPEEAGKKYSVMVVDDNVEILDFLTKILDRDYFVISAQSAEEALKILETNQVNMMVCDIMMGGMDGLELCRILKNDINICHIPIVMLTAKTDMGTKLEGLESGADAYIEKPFSTMQLKAQLRNLLRSREELKHKFAHSPLSEVRITSTNKRDEEFLEKVTEIINANITDTLFTVDMLAKEMLMSRTSFFTKLKAITGLTPNDFIKVTRLQAACRLMSEGEYRPSEICFLIGFNSSSYFAKCFSKQFGMLPGDYIKIVKEKRKSTRS